MRSLKFANFSDVTLHLLAIPTFIVDSERMFSLYNHGFSKHASAAASLLPRVPQISKRRIPKEFAKGWFGTNIFNFNLIKCLVLKLWYICLLCYESLTFGIGLITTRFSYIIPMCSVNACRAVFKSNVATNCTKGLHLSVFDYNFI